MKKLKQTKTINKQKLFLELLVVFLGVSAGFILNNLREGQKDRKLEQRYIESFIQDIDSNIVSLKEIINEDTLMQESLNRRLKVLGSADIPQDSINQIISMILSVSYLDLQTSTFEDIKFSGNLNLLRNYELKGKIVSHYDLLDVAKYVDGHYNHFFSETMLPYLLENYSLSEYKFFTDNHHSQRKFFNIASGYSSIRMQRTMLLKDVVSESEKLVKELKQYLDIIQ